MRECAGERECGDMATGVRDRYEEQVGGKKIT